MNYISGGFSCFPGILQVETYIHNLISLTLMGGPVLLKVSSGISHRKKSDPDPTSIKHYSCFIVISRIIFYPSHCRLQIRYREGISHFQGVADNQLIKRINAHSGITDVDRCAKEHFKRM